MPTIRDDAEATTEGDGLGMPGPEAACETAMNALPKIAADEVPRDGDHRHFAVRCRMRMVVPLVPPH